MIDGPKQDRGSEGLTPWDIHYLGLYTNRNPLPSGGEEEADRRVDRFVHRILYAATTSILVWGGWTIYALYKGVCA